MLKFHLCQCGQGDAAKHPLHIHHHHWKTCFLQAASVGREAQPDRPCVPTGSHWRPLPPSGSQCPLRESDNTSLYAYHHQRSPSVDTQAKGRSSPTTMHPWPSDKLQCSCMDPEKPTLDSATSLGTHSPTP